MFPHDAVAAAPSVLFNQRRSISIFMQVEQTYKNDPQNAYIDQTSLKYVLTHSQTVFTYGMFVNIFF